jgi:N-Acetylglucosaminyltransferase-IV (GnT-IV) conserved region
VLNCIRELIGIIEAKFKSKYKAGILVLVSGRDVSDIAHHRAGLQAAFRAEIRGGLVKLVDAPIEMYPTLHGLPNHYDDDEQRVRWRSKQNLDISSAFFAAKGMGKYIMVIEDDSSFKADKMFSGIRQFIANLHRQYNPNDAVEYNPRVVANGKGKMRGGKSGFEMMMLALKNQSGPHPWNLTEFSYFQDVQDPAETEMGHREIWSQVRFSFGYSGVLIHDEDAFVFAMMHFLLYQEKPCDLQFEIANSVRTGLSKDHFLRNNKQYRFIQHAGKISTLEGKVWND